MRSCGAALKGSRIVAFYFQCARLFGTNPHFRRSEPMAKASKTGKAIITEPSFVFFLGALAVMLFLVVVTAVYFSVHT